MLSTSKDIFYVGLIFCIGILTFFICWCMYYLISSIRDIREITKGAKDKFRKIDEIIDKIHDKIEKTSSNIGLLTEVIKRGIGAFMSWRENNECEMKDKKDKKSKKS